MEINGLDISKIWAAVDRILASQAFLRQGRARSILRYVIEETVAGRGSAIKEYGIAHSVFGRSEYDPKVDSLVRVEVAKLRRKLAEYYGTEGQSDPLQIELPKGCYAPVFREVFREVLPKALPEGAAAEGKPQSFVREHPPRRLLAGGACAAAIVAISLTVWLFRADPVRAPLPLGIAVGSISDSSGKWRSASDGLRTELANALSRSTRWRVVGREQAHAVLAGSIAEEAGGRLRIYLQLSRSQDEYHLWNATYDREPSGMPAALHEIASQTEYSFRMKLPGTMRALREPGTKDPDAWHFYVRGAQFLDNGQPAEAAEMYRAAIAKDPGFGLAHAGIARSLVQMADWGLVRGQEVWRQAIASADEASRLEPNAVLVNQAVGQVRAFAQTDWRRAEEAFRRAVEADPTEVDVRLDLVRLVLVPQRRFAEAEHEIKGALAMNDGLNILWSALAQLYLKTGNVKGAYEAAERAFEISPGGFAAACLRGMTLMEIGQIDEGLAYLRKVKNEWGRSMLAVALARSGRPEEAREVLTTLTDGCRRSAVLAALQDRDEALRELERAVSEKSAPYLWIAVEPQYMSLRQDQRFQELCRRLGLRAE